MEVKNKIPNTKIFEFHSEVKDACSVGVNQNNIHSITENKTVVITALPGAFTPTCSTKHLPDFIKNYSKIIDANVNTVCFISVNDPFVMHAWGELNNVPPTMRMLADSNAEFTREMGLSINLEDIGLGLRSHRYTLVVKNSVIEYMSVDESPSEYIKSNVENLLNNLT